MSMGEAGDFMGEGQFLPTRVLFFQNLKGMCMISILFKKWQTMITSKELVATCFVNGVPVGAQCHSINCNCVRSLRVRSLACAVCHSTQSFFLN